MLMSRRLNPQFYLLLATILLIGLTAFLVMARPLTSLSRESKRALELKVVDQNGRMRVDWNPADPLIQTAQGGTLEVEDGGAFNRYPVEPNVLRSGGLDYVRRSDDVFLTLTLYHDGRPGVQASVRRISPVDASLAATPDARDSGGSRTRRR